MRNNSFIGKIYF